MLSMMCDGKQVNQISSELSIRGKDIKGWAATAKEKHFSHDSINMTKIKD